MAKQGSSTKQLKQTLGFWDLMSTAIGQIIGAGIMTLLGSAIALTGRSVPTGWSWQRGWRQGACSEHAPPRSRLPCATMSGEEDR